MFDARDRNRTNNENFKKVENEVNGFHFLQLARRVGLVLLMV